MKLKESAKCRLFLFRRFNGNAQVNSIPDEVIRLAGINDVPIFTVNELSNCFRYITTVRKNIPKILSQ